MNDNSATAFIQSPHPDTAYLFTNEGRVFVDLDTLGQGIHEGIHDGMDMGIVSDEQAEYGHILWASLVMLLEGARDELTRQIFGNLFD